MLRVIKNLFVCLLLLFNFFFGDSVFAESSNEKSLVLAEKKSAVVLKKIKARFEIYQKKNLSPAKLKSKMYQTVSHIIPLVPNVSLKPIDSEGLKKKALERTELVFPLSKDDLKIKYSKQASKKYKMASVGQFVVVYYRRDGSKYKISGRYLDRKRDILTIGSKSIKLSEIDLKYQHFFDAKIVEAKKKLFVFNALKNYQEKKKLYFENYYYESKHKIVRANIDAGYLYYKNKWATAGEVIDSMLNKEIQNIVIAKGQSKRKNIGDLKLIGHEYNNFANYKINLSLSNYGIDTVSGIKNIYWNMNFENVAAVLNESNLNQANSFKDIYTYENKNERIRFYFFKNEVYKFSVTRTFNEISEAETVAKQLLYDFAYYKSVKPHVDENLFFSDQLFKRSLAKISCQKDKIKFNKPVKWRGKDIVAELVVAQNKVYKVKLTVEKQSVFK